jgi:hypothetical protein
VTHLLWYVESARYAFDVLAELAGHELPSLDVPEHEPSAHAPAHRHLVQSLRSAASPGNEDRNYSEWRARCDYRLARHLQQVDAVGADLAGDDRADVARLVGRRAGQGFDAGATLLQYVVEDTGRHDRDLIDLFARRLQRMHMLTGPPGSRVVHHVPLQPLPDRAASRTEGASR